MSANSHIASSPVAVGTKRTPGPALRRAEAAAYIGAISAIAFTIVTLVGTITPDGKHFQHAADYWYTGIGMLPAMAAPLVLVPALHTLQRGRDGRRGLAGVMLMCAGLTVFVVLGCYGLLISAATSLGPTYLLATLATVIGLPLFVAGSWRVGLLPRWLLIVWIVAWIVGGPFAQAATPLLLAAVYVMIGVIVPRRVELLVD
jgi:hypothetical protein